MYFSTVLLDTRDKISMGAYHIAQESRTMVASLKASVKGMRLDDKQYQIRDVHALPHPSWKLVALISLCVQVAASCTIDRSVSLGTDEVA